MRRRINEGILRDFDQIMTWTGSEGKEGGGLAFMKSQDYDAKHDLWFLPRPKKDGKR